MIKHNIKRYFYCYLLILCFYSQLLLGGDDFTNPPPYNIHEKLVKDNIPLTMVNTNSNTLITDASKTNINNFPTNHDHNIAIYPYTTNIPASSMANNKANILPSYDEALAQNQPTYYQTIYLPVKKTSACCEKSTVLLFRCVAVTITAFIFITIVGYYYNKKHNTDNENNDFVFPTLKTPFI